MTVVTSRDAAKETEYLSLAENSNPAGIISRVILYAEKMSGKRSGMTTGLIFYLSTGFYGTKTRPAEYSR